MNERARVIGFRDVEQTFGRADGSAVTALDDVACRYVAVPRARGQQLKDVAQLDGWLRDGSAARVERLCAFE